MNGAFAEPLRVNSKGYEMIIFDEDRPHRTNTCPDPRAKPTRADAIFIQDNALWMSHNISI
jgi:hypothetical protein